MTRQRHEARTAASKGMGCALDEAGDQSSVLGRLASPDTVLGKLQRGTGDGFRAALTIPRSDAVELLWSCVVRDPRWDQQVESRGRYYADLVTLAGLDLDRLRPEHCPDPPAGCDQRLVVDVLGELALDGDAEAGAVLLDHVVAGTEWDGAIAAIAQTPGDLHRQLPEVLEQRFDAEELARIVQRWQREIDWRDLAAEHPWVQRALARAGDRVPQPVMREPLPSMDRPASELLRFEWPGAPSRRLIHRLTAMLRPGEREQILAALDCEVSAQTLAFRVLALLDDPGGLDAAEAILTEDRPGRARAGAARYVSSLTAAHTLEVARGWLDAEDGRHSAALAVFGRHAEPRDGPMLIGRLEDAWRERQFYDVCSLIDAFARLPALMPHELMRSIFAEAEYSYARRRAARVIAVAGDGRLPRDLAEAAVFDCEGEIQDLGLASLEPNAGREVHERAAALRDRRLRRSQ